MADKDVEPWTELRGVADITFPNGSKETTECWPKDIRDRQEKRSLCFGILGALTGFLLNAVSDGQAIECVEDADMDAINRFTGGKIITITIKANEKAAARMNG